MTLEDETERGLGADDFAMESDVVVVGAGGAGLTAAIAAAKGGARVLVLEKAKKPLSNTARSGGMIPPAGTRLQREAGIEETPEAFAEDIFHKNGHTSDRATTLHLARAGRDLVEWLVDDVGVELTFIGDFKYPGHTQFRMHAPKSRTGAALVDDLRKALQAEPEATLVNASPAVGLCVRDGAVTGVVVEQAGARLRIGAGKVILACNGYGGNRAMLERYCPEIASAMYFGGEGSTGEGITWGLELGGEIAFMDAYQGHASVASPHGVLVTYAVIMEGGVQVNSRGERFVDETRGYSENALRVLGQPGGVAVEVYDERIHQLAMQFEDYRDAALMGAIKRAETLGELARAFELDPGALARTMDAYEVAARGEANDAFGRASCRVLSGHVRYGVRVTGALFHTQGGLSVDEAARVTKRGGGVVANLYAAGGVAAGISGHGPGGYLSGNGLLTALSYGMLAGRDAARAVRERSQRVEQGAR